MFWYTQPLPAKVGVLVEDGNAVDGEPVLGAAVGLVGLTVGGSVGAVGRADGRGLGEVGFALGEVLGICE